MPNKLAHVSARKIAANRQNALKSTGPKTLEGRAHSRRNALKHGLFAMDLYIAALTKWEDPDEYQNLLQRLAESYQPVGAAEELEVQQIAVCWWKRARAWRYENAEIACQLAIRHTAVNTSDALSQMHRIRLELLKKAELEIEATGQLSEELKGEIFGNPECAGLWNLVDETLSIGLAKDMDVTPRLITEARKSDPEAAKNFLWGVARGVTLLLVRNNESLAAEVAKLSNDVEAIPRTEALDRLLRAETAIERSLNLAINRLECLQRRRKAQAGPPPVSIRVGR